MEKNSGNLSTSLEIINNAIQLLAGEGADPIKMAELIERTLLREQILKEEEEKRMRKAKLAEKMSKFSRYINSRLSADGRNAFHKFDYISKDALIGAISMESLPFGLSFSSCLDKEYANGMKSSIAKAPSSKGKNATNTKTLIEVAEYEVMMIVEVTDIETGYSKLFYGLGYDSSADKQYNKASTNANKYILFKALNITDRKEKDTDSQNQNDRVQLTDEDMSQLKELNTLKTLPMGNLQGLLKAIQDGNEIKATLSGFQNRLLTFNSKGKVTKMQVTPDQKKAIEELL